MSRRSRAFPVAVLLSLVSSGIAAAGSEPVYVGFVPSHDQLVLGYEKGGLVLLSYPDLQVVRSFQVAPDLTLEGVALSHDGAWLAADFARGSVWVWEIATGETKLEIPRSRPRTTPIFLFLPGDDVLLLFQDGQLGRWHLDRGRPGESVRPVSRVRRMTVSPDGRYLVVEGQCAHRDESFDLCVYLLEEDLVLAAASLEALRGPAPNDESWEVRDLVYTPDNRILVRSTAGFVFQTENYLFLSPAELRPTDAGPWDAEKPDEIPSCRSEPRRQLSDRTADGEWLVRVLSESAQLGLYAPDPDSDGEGALRTVAVAPLP